MIYHLLRLPPYSPNTFEKDTFLSSQLTPSTCQNLSVTSPNTLITSLSENRYNTHTVSPTISIKQSMPIRYRQSFSSSGDFSAVISRPTKKAKQFLCCFQSDNIEYSELESELLSIIQRAKTVALQIFFGDTKLEEKFKIYIRYKYRYNEICRLMCKINNKDVPEYIQLSDKHLVKAYVLEHDILDVLLSYSKFKDYNYAYQLMQLIYKYNCNQYASKIACILRNNLNLFDNLEKQKQDIISKNVTEKSLGEDNEDVMYVHQKFTEQKYTIQEISDMINQTNEIQLKQIIHFINNGTDINNIIKAIELSDSILKTQRDSILKI